MTTISTYKNYFNVQLWMCLMVFLLLGIEMVHVSLVIGSRGFQQAYAEPNPLIQGSMTAIYPLTAAAFPTNGCGRIPPLLLIGVVVWIAAHLLQCLMISQPWFFFSRAIKGATVGFISTAVPFYVTQEFSEQHHVNLATVFSLCQAFVPLGMILASLCALINKLGVSFTFCWMAAVACAVPLIPFSLRASLMSYRCCSSGSSIGNDRAKLRSLKASTESHDQVTRPNWAQTLKGEFRALSTDSSLAIGIFQASFIQMLAQGTGISVIMYYAGYICQMAGLDDATKAYVIIALHTTNFVTVVIKTLVSSSSRWERLTTLRQACLILAVLHGINGIIMMGGHSVDPSTASNIHVNPSVVWKVGPNAGKLILGCCFVFVATFAAKVVSVAMTYTIELVPHEVYSLGICIASISGWVLNFLFALVIPYLFVLLRFGIFFLFCLLCLAMYLILIGFEETNQNTKFENNSNKEFSSIPNWMDCINRINQVFKSRNIIFPILQPKSRPNIQPEPA